MERFYDNMRFVREVDFQVKIKMFEVCYGKKSLFYDVNNIIKFYRLENHKREYL